ncbi:hypothetical protein SO802_005204 [Lithocarpus litseifolius]|uniref:Uncharacterized protein n=1 Tax=Lithocarpus litseifolius TaxID=425828 RepID=A0AAW2DM44_9ROSI
MEKAEHQTGTGIGFYLVEGMLGLPAVAARDVIKEGSKWKVGDGRYIEVSNHIWLSHKPIFLGEARPNLFVNELIDNGTGQWDREKVFDLFAHRTSMEILQMPLSRLSSRDVLLGQFGSCSVICFGCFCCCLDSVQACNFFKWLDNNTCPRGRATAPLVHERFRRYKAEAVAARNERDEAYVREAETRELLRIAKRKAEKSKLALRIAEDKVYNLLKLVWIAWRFAAHTILSGLVDL